MAPLSLPCGTKLLSDFDKAEALNAYFTSVFLPRSKLFNNIDLLFANCPQSKAVFFSVPVVIKALLNSKHTLSSGPDNIPFVFWAKRAHVLAFPVSVIFTSSYLTSLVPTDLKYATVTPIYKKGNASLMQNYRPISLTCTLRKTMESIIRDNKLAHLVDNNPLDKNQHGFLPCHSATSQLIEYYYDWSCANDVGYLVDVVYIGFSKAFDGAPSILHRLLHAI